MKDPSVITFKAFFELWVRKVIFPFWGIGDLLHNAAESLNGGSAEAFVDELRFAERLPVEIHTELLPEVLGQLVDESLSLQVLGLFDLEVVLKILPNLYINTNLPSAAEFY
jgi:hypothetical protein